MSSCCVVVGLLSREVIGWQDQHDFASYTKTRQAPLWLVGHVIVPPYHAIIAPYSDESCVPIAIGSALPVSKYLSGKYHALFITWSSSIMLYHPPSHTMSYASILTHHWTKIFPMTTFFLSLWWFIRSHDPLHFLNNLTNHSHPPFCLCFLLSFY